MAYFNNSNEIKKIILDAYTNKYTISINSKPMNADEFVLTTKSGHRHRRIQNRMNRIIEINTFENYIIVESGITWVEIIDELDKIGCTILTTQSGLTFSVGGSFCGNAHGRKTYIPMIKDTVTEFTFMDGEGDIHTVDEKSDVYHAFPGSLGLLGVILTLKINIRKNYNVCTNQEIIPYNEKSLNYIWSLSQNPNTCMINFQASYFPSISEIILVYHTYDNNSTINDKFDSYKYLTDSRWYYTFCILILLILSFFNFLNPSRWNIEKYVSESAISKQCININTAFDTWSKPYNPGFRIIEFFFPKKDFIYCQMSLMNIFTKHGMTPLSCGSRIIYEKNASKTYIRFSGMASITNPYISLVIDFIANDNLENVAKDIRTQIIEKNIHMTYHTTYEFSFNKTDMVYMFPHIDDFKDIKKQYDKNGLFLNEFYLKYLSD